MKYSFVAFFDCSWVMEHLKFSFELCNWLWFVIVVNYNHAPADIFSDKLFVSFHCFYTNTCEFACIRLATRDSVNMNGLDGYILKNFQRIRSEQALFI